MRVRIKTDFHRIGVVLAAAFGLLAWVWHFQDPAGNRGDVVTALAMCGALYAMVLALGWIVAGLAAMACRSFAK
jgi:hypothetical protein